MKTVTTFTLCKNAGKELQYNNNMDRFEKLEWIKDTTSEEHVNEMFLTELVAWMSEDEFNKFYEHHCRCWNIDNINDMDDEE